METIDLTSNYNNNAAKVTPPQPKAPPPPPPEDQTGGVGQTIDTFASYNPTALPNEIVEALNAAHTNTPFTLQKTAHPEIIELSDDDDDSDNEENESNNDNDHKTKKNGSKNDSQPQRLELTCPSHTSLACESALLSSVRAPQVPLATAECLLELAQKGALSPLQLESVLLAIQRHNRKLDQMRAGFFIGDGAGVGKGRQIAAILRDSFCRQGHTRRHVWLSVSQELVQDARRDLTDIACYAEVHDGTQFLNRKHGLGISDKGVFFCTYQLLVSQSRIDEIVNWCAGISAITKKADRPRLEQEFNGCIVFDEAHKAKNLNQDTRTAKLVIRLQRRLPNARVVYCSATGVSDVGHMVYAERLGLWKTHASQANFSLFESFSSFQKTLEQRGLGSLEMLALEMKQVGCFMARTLSWDGAEFETFRISLDPEQQRVYDLCVNWWIDVKRELQEICDSPHMRANPPGRTLWGTFWSAHQRFFKELTICCKIPQLAKDAKKMVAQGNCVIFGLQTTGDASMQNILANGGHLQEFSTLISSAQNIMSNFLMSHFLVAPLPIEAPNLPEEPGVNASQYDRELYLLMKARADAIVNMPSPAIVPEFVAKRDALLARIDSIPLPPNPLDDLIDRLGGVDQVSEMTGRPGRIVRKSGSFCYAKRASGDPNDRVNLVEKRDFMDGKKPYAIISDAASTGISLHAARGSKASHKRRIHYTIELPWSADKAVQQLGRSHRSAQESAPNYKLVVTDLGGESRFAAAVSKRMASLGALTKGDRRAATGSDMLSDFDLDSRYGQKAMKRFYRALSIAKENRGENNPETAIYPSRSSQEILDKFAVDGIKAKNTVALGLPEVPITRRLAILSLVCQDLEDVGISMTNKTGDVKTFLNRIFGLPVLRQNLIFSLFMSTLEDVIGEAKLTGEFEGSAEDIKATTIEIAEERVVATDPSCGAETKLITLILDRGISFAMVCEMAKEEAMKIEHPIEAIDEEKAQEDHVDEADEGNSDDDDDEDEWLSTRIEDDRICEAGFYFSKKKIAGRHLVMFAKPKFPTTSFKSEAEARDTDPLGLMIITRPNTGTNPCEMKTRDLRQKYHLVLGCEALRKELDKQDAAEQAQTENAPNSLTDVVKQANRNVGFQWELAFDDSNHFEHKNGLAPRRSELGLVTGAVLHVLRTLEKVVIFKGKSEKTLKVMRAEVETSPKSTHRLVGVCFPLDDESMKRLDTEMDDLRKKHLAIGKVFHDEAIGKVCQKSKEWATTEPKTMRSFFQVVPKRPAGSLANVPIKLPAPSGKGKRSPEQRLKPVVPKKKPKAITAFFSKK
ncbi:unnamed protein product [Cylindrotheca closterium]|uniref:Helicase ATP-binding domain-containing protein n=1 Tax=Cylindrotheca closterium TaxID=2856 RepID=A0AAD2PWA3_9STRA|nr:unnamed protein product [Cylindrotheca closterium]